jgi:hypothetical protein
LSAVFWQLLLREDMAKHRQIARRAAVEANARQVWCNSSNQPNLAFSSPPPSKLIIIFLQFIFWNRES